MSDDDEKFERLLSALERLCLAVERTNDLTEHQIAMTEEAINEAADDEESPLPTL